MQSLSLTLQIKLLQRQLNPLHNGDEGPALMLIRAAAQDYNNVEWQRQVVDLLPYDKISTLDLREVCRSTYSFKTYQIALAGALQIVQRFHRCDDRFVQLLREHTFDLLENLKENSFDLITRRHYWKLASTALQILPEPLAPPLLTFQRLATTRTWSNEIPDELRNIVRPSREEMLKEVEELLGQKKYDECVDLVRHMPQTDYRVLASAIAGLLNANARTQAARVAQILLDTYSDNPESIHEDLEGWSGKEWLALSIQLLDPDAFSIRQLCQALVGRSTYANIQNSLTSDDLGKTLNLYDPFPPALSEVIDHLLHQPCPNRNHLKKIAEHLINLPRFWFDEKLQDSTKSLLRYFAINPFDKGNQEEYTLAKGFLTLASFFLSRHASALDDAIAAFPTTLKRLRKEECAPDFKAYQTVLRTLNRQLQQGANPREVVCAWRQVYTCFRRVGSPAAGQQLNEHLNASFFPFLMRSALRLGSQKKLPSAWWPLSYISACALFKQVASGSLSSEEGAQIIDQVQQLLLTHAQSSSHEAYNCHLLLLGNSAIMSKSKWTLYQRTALEWARPIFLSIASNKAPWRFKSALDVVNSLPNALSNFLLPDMARRSLEESSRRFALYQYPSPPCAKRLYKAISDSHLFTSNLSYIWSAYTWLYYSQSHLNDTEFLQCHLYWAGLLINSNSEEARAIGLGIYRVLHSFIMSLPSSSKKEMLTIALDSGIPVDAADQAKNLMISRTRLGELATSAHLRIFALEQHSQNAQGKSSSSKYKEIKLIQERCEEVRLRMEQEDSAVTGCLRTIEWTLAGARISQYNDPAIYKHLKNTIALVERGSAGIEPIDRAFLSYRLLASLLQTPPTHLSQEKRTSLLTKLLQPQLTGRLFLGFSDLQIGSLTLAFASPFTWFSDPAYEIITKEYFRLLRSGVVDAPLQIRSETLVSWYNWSLQKIGLDQTNLHIHNEFNKNTLTEHEYQILVSLPSFSQAHTI